LQETPRQSFIETYDCKHIKLSFFEQGKKMFRGGSFARTIMRHVSITKSSRGFNAFSTSSKQCPFFSTNTTSYFQSNNNKKSMFSPGNAIRCNNGNRDLLTGNFIQSGPNAMNWDLIGISSDEDDDGA
jgi:hypothetical protein